MKDMLVCFSALREPNDSETVLVHQHQPGVRQVSVLSASRMVLKDYAVYAQRASIAISVLSASRMVLKVGDSLRHETSQPCFSALREPNGVVRHQRPNGTSRRCSFSALCEPNGVESRDNRSMTYSARMFQCSPRAEWC